MLQSAAVLRFWPRSEFDSLVAFRAAVAGNQQSSGLILPAHPCDKGVFIGCTFGPRKSNMCGHTEIALTLSVPPVVCGAVQPASSAQPRAVIPL